MKERASIRLFKRYFNIAGDHLSQSCDKRFYFSDIMCNTYAGVFDHCVLSVKKLFVYLERNALAVVVFSPIFTIVCSRFIPYFKFDPTHFLFTLLSLVITVVGCMLCAWGSDKLGLSRFLFCKRNFYVGYKTISC